MSSIARERLLGNSRSAQVMLLLGWVNVLMSALIKLWKLNFRFRETLVLCLITDIFDIRPDSNIKLERIFLLQLKTY